MSNKDFRDTFIHKIEKKYGDSIYNKIGPYQEKYGFEIGKGSHATWNNEADAFKHAFMQADLARKWGNFIAEQAGNFHEWEGNKFMGQAKGEENMDKWNNQQGREIAQEIQEEYLQHMPKNNLFQKLPQTNWDDLIAKKVMERMKSGQLITNPNDKRKYNENKSWFGGKGKSTGHAASVNNNNDFDESKGHWITNQYGNHVFIED